MMQQNRTDEAPGFRLKECLPLAMIILTGALLRMVGSQSHSLSVDEAITWLIAVRPVMEIVPFMDFIQEVHPPLYFILIHMWMYLGTGEWVMRLSSILCGTASIAMIYLVACEISDRKSAFYAALMLSLSSFHITYSQELRMYPLLTLLFLISFWTFHRWIATGKGGFLILTAAVNLAALHIHYLAVFMLIIESLWFLCNRGPLKNMLVSHLIAQSAAVILFLPWLYHFINLRHMQDFTLRLVPGLNNCAVLLIQLIMGPHFPPLEGGGQPSFILITGGFLLLLPLAAGLMSFDRKLFPALFLFLPALVIILLSRFTSVRIFEYKYFMIIIPAVFIVLGKFIASFRIRTASLLIPGIFILFNLISISNFAFDSRYGPQNWRMACAIMQYYEKKNDIIIVHPSMMSSGVYYYYHGKGRIEGLDSPGSTDLKEKLKPYARIWLCTVPHHPYVRMTGLEKCIMKSLGRRFIVKGHCSHCGTCCRNMALFSGSGKIRSEEEYRKLCVAFPEYRCFVPGKMHPAGFLLFSCRELNEKNLCSIYKKRPGLCRRFPDPAAFDYIHRLPPQCSYRIIPLMDFEEFLQNEDKKLR